MDYLIMGPGVAALACFWPDCIGAYFIGDALFYSPHRVHNFRFTTHRNQAVIHPSPNGQICPRHAYALLALLPCLTISATSARYLSRLHYSADQTLEVGSVPHGLYHISISSIAHLVLSKDSGSCDFTPSRTFVLGFRSFCAALHDLLATSIP